MPGWQDFTSLSQQYLAEDLLISDLSLILNPSQVYIPVLEHAYGALSVSLTAQVAATITVKIVDATGIVPTWTQRQVATGFGDVLQFSPPYSYPTASALAITVTSSVNQVSNCPTFIFGFGTPINGGGGVGNVRPDGRAYPIGQNVNSGLILNATGPATIAAAPGAGLHILVRSLNVGVAASGAQADIFGTIGGATSTLLSGGTGTAISYESGLLMDANTALTVQSGAVTTVRGNAIWDVVA
jgi:hypothetical protein